MSKPREKNAPKVRDRAKQAASNTKSNIIETFSPNTPVRDEPLVGESKREHVQIKPVVIPALSTRRLLVRAMSGLLYVSINIVGILLGNFWCALVMSCTAGICCWEFYRLMRADAKDPNQIIGLVIACLMPFVCMFSPVLLVGLVFLLVMLLGFWYVIDENVRIIDVAVSTFGPLYTGMTMAALVAIRSSVVLGNEAACIICIVVMASVWINDAAAYLVGSAFGRHKMVPNISPKKSWEGFAGGMLASVAVWCVLLLFPETHISVAIALICGVLCGLCAVLGDLVESRIKRGAGVKDSGNLIPGHGGLLDRSDSMLFVAIAAYFLLRIAGVM